MDSSRLLIIFQVTLGSKSQKHAYTSNDAPSLSPPSSQSKDHTYKNKFEVPPRLQKASGLGRSTSLEQPSPPIVGRSTSTSDEQQNSSAVDLEDLNKVYRIIILVLSKCRSGSQFETFYLSGI